MTIETWQVTLLIAVIGAVSAIAVKNPKYYEKMILLFSVLSGIPSYTYFGFILGKNEIIASLETDNFDIKLPAPITTELFEFLPFLPFVLYMLLLLIGHIAKKAMSTENINTN